MFKLLVVEDDKVLSNNIKEILTTIGEITQVITVVKDCLSWKAVFMTLQSWI